MKNVANENFKLISNQKVSYKFQNNYVLNKLGTDNIIIMTKPDKGKEFLLLNKNYYLEKKTENILADGVEFKSLYEDGFNYILRFEEKLNRLLDTNYRSTFKTFCFP